jgi:serine/threonine-protein kinase
LALSVGTRLGSYEILSLLGSGGMGEVYRASDGKLDRDVAIKILPQALATDPDRVIRFEREARTLAALNHSNIAQIYGVEDAQGVPALVMELVEGPTLADRIARGTIPIDEALPIARQIAEALEAAHEQGIIHRDLKPANIKVREDGTVKVLDFGLAKALDPAIGLETNAAISPTISIHATQAGIILGTAAYMAPEQARGKTVDRRADIWAFGVVLFEMLTGKRAFEGDDISITLASVLKSEPDWGALQEVTPRALRHLLLRCLSKDPKYRLQAIGDARIEIDELLSGTSEPPLRAETTSPTLRWRRRFVGAVLVGVIATATGVIGWVIKSRTVVQPWVSRLTVSPASTAALSVNGLGRDVAMTPDGLRLVYVGANATTLFERQLDQLEPTPLAHGAALRDLFVSPDGQWVGFFDGPTTLKKVAISGGPAVPVTDIIGNERGATWAAADTIIVATALGGLQRISADGGARTVLMRPDLARGEGSYVWPELMPDGHSLLYTVLTAGGLDAASVALLDLRSGRVTVLLKGGSHAHYVPSGHLVYAAAGAMRAVRFDATRMQVVGPSIVVEPQVITSGTGAMDAGLSRDGTLVYVKGAGSSAPRTLVWVDRQGHETPVGAPARAYGQPRISPDGTRIAVSGGDRNIWIWDLARANLARLTADPTDGNIGWTNPAWTPDSRQVVFSANRLGAFGLFIQAADSTGAARQLTESPAFQAATGFSPDGKHVIIASGSKGRWDVMAAQLDAPHDVRPILQKPYNETNGMLSQDGRWLAYEATDSGTSEVYVRPFPAVEAGRWPVSTRGGTQPLWARSGQELFYIAPDGALMGVSVTPGPRWTASAPTKVLEGHYFVGSGLVGGNPPRNYDVTADGQRFLMMKTAGGDASDAPPQIVVVQHFDEELKRLLPTK